MNLDLYEECKRAGALSPWTFVLHEPRAIMATSAWVEDARDRDGNPVEWSCNGDSRKRLALAGLTISTSVEESRLPVTLTGWTMNLDYWFYDRGSHKWLIKKPEKNPGGGA